MYGTCVLYLRRIFCSEFGFAVRSFSATEIRPSHVRRIHRWISKVLYSCDDCGALLMSVAGALIPARKRPGPVNMGGSAAGRTSSTDKKGSFQRKIPRRKISAQQGKQSIEEWLESVKVGFASRFGALFTEAGWEDVADLHDYPPSPSEYVSASSRHRRRQMLRPRQYAALLDKGCTCARGGHVALCERCASKNSTQAFVSVWQNPQNPFSNI